MTPEFQLRLKLVLQKGLALTQSVALAIEQMENTHAAENVQSARSRAQSRRQVQNRGFYMPLRHAKWLKEKFILRWKRRKRAV